MKVQQTRRSLTTWMLCALLPIVSACAPNSGPDSDLAPPANFNRPASEAPRATQADMGAKATQTSLKSEGATANMPDEFQSESRMVIREASLKLQTGTPATLLAQATRLAEATGGFVVKSHSEGKGHHIKSIDLTMRVPAQDFEPTLTGLRTLGVVLDEHTSGQDVTEEYVDLNARLRAKRQLEDRLLSLLASSNSLDDTLRVEQEVARVRTEIEKMTGRARYLERRASMSTIHLNAIIPTPPAPPKPPVEEETFFSVMSDAFDDGIYICTQVCAGMVRIFMALLPLSGAFVIAGIFIALIAAIRRRLS